ncbi:MAG: Fe-S-containing protein [Lachnospiraceae bacterium]|nr:Fe-S-containing protein [Lachnospiraceae bacterium]
MNEKKQDNSILKILFPNRKSVIITSCVLAVMVIVAVVAIIVSGKNNKQDQYKLDIEVVQGLINASMDPEVQELADRIANNELSDEEFQALFGQYEVVANNDGIETRKTDGTKGGDIKVAKKDITGTGMYYNYISANGVFMQLIFVMDSDGKIHVGLNTCDECKGESDAYFERGYGIFKCKHCGAVAADFEVGRGVNPNAPAPVEYKSGISNITISEETLTALEDYFTNWDGPRNED